MATGDNLLEAVTADTIAHETARASKHSLPIGTPCPNCRTAIAGPWCYACGQRAEKYDRSILRLIGEMFEGIVDLDGRIWKTFPRLIFRPGKLTREYLDGHRAGQVPPFRIFLIVLLAVFFAGGENFAQNKQHFKMGLPNDPAVTANMSAKDKADYAQAMSKLAEFKSGKVTTADAAGKASPDKTVNLGFSPPGAGKATASQAFKIGPNDTININTGSPKSSAFWTAQVKKALNNPDAFFASAADWGHRLAVVMLPIAALMLSALFVFKKNTYVFDHLIFSMHSLSFQGLLLSAILLAALYWAPAWNFLWLAPVHLFVHMRGTYRISIVGTLLRMFVLFMVSSIVFGLMIGGLVMIGLATV